MNDKFTILTASYNRRKLLKFWYRSIVNQKYRPLEVVFVDDCSTDNSKDVLNRFSFKEHNIEFKYFYSKKKLYCASAYLKALKLSTGSYLGVLDSDDMLKENAVNYIMSLYKKYSEVCWIYTQFEHMRSRKKGICKMPKEGMSLLDMGKLGHHTYSHWRTFSRRCKDLESIFYPGLRCAVDKYMGYRLEELGEGAFVDEICYKYRESVKNSISKIEKTKKTWKSKVLKASIDRRRKQKIKPYKIIEI